MVGQFLGHRMVAGQLAQFLAAGEVDGRVADMGDDQVCPRLAAMVSVVPIPPSSGRR